jgi:hypothetical protein
LKAQTGKLFFNDRATIQQGRRAIFDFGTISYVVVNGVPKPSNASGMKVEKKVRESFEVKIFNAL